MLKQAIKLIRLFGLGPLIRRKRNHDTAQPILRGYASTVCFTTLLNTGFFDELLAQGIVTPEEFARRHQLDAEILHHILEYLDCVGIVRIDEGVVRMTKLGRTLMSDPRGSFELTCGYFPILQNLEGILARKVKYRRDVNRAGTYIARGSGQLGRQLPFPMVRSLVLKRGSKKVLDLGAGNVEFLEMVCEGTDIACRGVEIDPEAVAEARRQLSTSKYANRITIVEGDMFNVAPMKEAWPDTDGIIAIDTFHEYFKHEPERIVQLLKELKAAFPKATFYIAEFCRQPHEWLRKHPTSFVEHHLYHNLTEQKILSPEEFGEVFKAAGLTLVEQHVFSIVGHGYFVLR